MNQEHRRHGGGGYTLLYYIGLEGKEDRRTEEQKKENGTEDKRTKEQKKGKRDGRQKDKRTEKKGKGNGRQKDRRTKEQKKGQETYSYLPFLMPPTSSLFSMVISVFFTEALSLPKR